MIKTTASNVTFKEIGHEVGIEAPTSPVPFSDPSIQFLATRGSDITTVVGSSTAGATDGTGTQATCTSIKRLCRSTDNANLIYFTDGHAVRSFNAQTYVVTTIAGSVTTAGYVNGPGGTARFNNPQGLTMDNSGNIYVCDYSNFRIRKIVAATGDVSLFAGTGAIGNTNSTIATSATFTSPKDIVYASVTRAGTTINYLFIADYYPRWITLSGTNAVSSLTTIFPQNTITKNDHPFSPYIFFNTSGGGIYYLDPYNGLSSYTHYGGTTGGNRYQFDGPFNSNDSAGRPSGDFGSIQDMKFTSLSDGSVLYVYSYNDTLGSGLGNGSIHQVTNAGIRLVAGRNGDNDKSNATGAQVSDTSAYNIGLIGATGGILNLPGTPNKLYVADSTSIKVLTVYKNTDISVRKCLGLSYNDPDIRFWYSAGSYTVTVPADCTKATMWAVGGGGGGVRGGLNTTMTAYGGGGGGVYSTWTGTVTPGVTLSVVVGAGGAISSTAGGTGGSGGTSYVFPQGSPPGTLYASAAGGTGGSGANGGSCGVVAGGIGGSAASPLWRRGGGGAGFRSAGVTPTSAALGIGGAGKKTPGSETNNFPKSFFVSAGGGGGSTYDQTYASTGGYDVTDIVDYSYTRKINSGINTAFSIGFGGSGGWSRGTVTVPVARADGTAGSAGAVCILFHN